MAHITYTQELADAICAQLAEGMSLREICRADGMPSESAVRLWAREDREGFSAQYTRAREIGYERLADEILFISDTPVEGVEIVAKADGGIEERRGDMLGHRKLQVDSRKWMLSKMLPKVYGDKLTQAIENADDKPFKTESTVTLTPEEAYKRMLGGG